MRFIKKSYLNGTTLNDPIRSMIKSRLSKRRNQNFVCFWAGPTGSGKTYSAVSYFAKVDDNFGAENVIWTMREFMEVLTTKQFRNGKKLIPGSVIIFDEFASQVGSRDWYSVINKVCIKVLQTFRDLNIAVCFTGPSLSLADSKTQVLLHAYFENESDPIYKYALVKTRVYQLVHNSRLNRNYTHHYNFVLDGDKLKIPAILVGLPPTELIEEIEKLSRESKQDIREKGESSIDAFIDEISAKRNKRDRVDHVPIGNKVLEQLDTYYYKAQNGMTTVNARLIATNFNISLYAAQTVAQYVKSRIDLTTGKRLNK